MVDKWRYPPNLPAIGRRIRSRDGWRCCWFGVGGTLFDFHALRPVRLTTMHLDRDSSNNADWNLDCAWWPCRVTYDAPDPTAARAEARLRCLVDAGQLERFPELL